MLVTAQPPMMPFWRPPPRVAVDTPPMVPNVRRAVSPAWPLGPVKSKVPPAWRTREAALSTAELTPVPPVVTTKELAPEPIVTAPMDSDVLV